MTLVDDTMVERIRRAMRKGAEAWVKLVEKTAKARCICDDGPHPVDRPDGSFCCGRCGGEL